MNPLFIEEYLFRGTYFDKAVNKRIVRMSMQEEIFATRLVHSK